jgi:hypothetical protein
VIEVGMCGLILNALPCARQLPAARKLRHMTGSVKLEAIPFVYVTLGELMTNATT